ncbi:hypothetical protein [Roseovarius sp. E0-M6]|uniref:hypothetical protein n=1 Tax=Roseovarius sp. E0-M6 TaxID=3127118 RepID=UPI00300F7C7A
MSTTETYRIDWEGIALSVRWTPQWLGIDIDGQQVAHLELISDERVPLSMTETGYRSHFTSRELVETEGGPVAFVKKWLDVEAMSDEWKAHEDAARQLSLF